MARQNPRYAKQARELLAARYAKDADIADTMAGMAPSDSLASDLKQMGKRKRKYAATAKRMAGG